MPAEDAEVLAQVGRLGDGEVETEHPDVDGLLDRQYSGNVLLELT